MDARYCALSRVSFGLIAGGAGVGSGDIPRATARATSTTSPSSVVGTSVTAPGRLCGWARCRPRRAGQARPGRSLSSAIGPGPLVRPEPVAPPAPSQYSASVRGGLPTSLLSPLAGVGHCPLAMAMGRLPGCWSACWIAGPYRHSSPRGRAVGRVRAGTVAVGSPSAPFCEPSVGGSGAVAPGPACVLSAGPSPWWRTASGARLRRSRGHRAGRGQSAGPSSPAGVRLVSGGKSLSGLRPLGSS